jgi:uncharacterized protein YutE (UPF0331/DUF86 family)
MSELKTSDADILESLLPRYEAEGFDVFVHPSPSIRPPFMQDYRPDAVALRRDRKIAIEVVRPEGNSSKKVQDLQSLFAPHRDWELRVFYVSPRTQAKAIEVATRKAIDESIRVVLALKSDGRLLPTLVMAWATLEAIGRALLPDQLRRPQTPERLVEVLAAEGYLTLDEANTVRTAISLRNAAVHGGLDVPVDERLLERFVGILQTLADFVPPA